MKVETLKALRNFVTAVKYRSGQNIYSARKSADNNLIAALDAEIEEVEWPKPGEPFIPVVVEGFIHRVGQDGVCFDCNARHPR